MARFPLLRNYCQNLAPSRRAEQALKGHQYSLAMSKSSEQYLLLSRVLPAGRPAQLIEHDNYLGTQTT